MRLTDLIDKEHSFRYLVGFVLALLFFIGVSVPSNSLAGFYANLEGLSDSVERSDFSTAEEQLAEVSSFYEGSRAWGMQGLVDSYLFQDAFLTARIRDGDKQQGRQHNCGDDIGGPDKRAMAPHGKKISDLLRHRLCVRLS